MNRLTEAIAAHQQKLKPATTQPDKSAELPEEMTKLLGTATLGMNTVFLGIAEIITPHAVKMELEHFSAEVRKGIALLQCSLRLADEALEKL